MLEPRFQLAHHHKGVETADRAVGHQGVGEFILDIAGRNAMHPLLAGIGLEFAHRIFGEAGQRAPVIELHLLHQGQVGVFRLFQAGENRPHGGNFQRVGRDMFAQYGTTIEITIINMHLIAEAGHIGHIDLDRAVAQRFHIFVGQEFPIFRLVGMADDHFVDIGLRKLFGLDLVFLRRCQQIIEEGDIQFEQLNEFDDATVGNIQFAVEVKGTRVRVRTIFSDLAIVDIAGQLSGVLILLIFGLEGANADAVLFGKNETTHPHMFDHLAPIALVLFHQLAMDMATGGAQFPFDGNFVLGGIVLV